MIHLSQINLFKKKLLSNPHIFFVTLTLVSGLINYAYYPVISKILPVGEFGISQGLIAILTQAGAAFSGISILTIYLSKIIGQAQTRKIIYAIQKIIILLIIFLTFSLLLFQDFLTDYLKVGNQLNIPAVSIDLLLSIPFIVATSFLIANKKFIKAANLQLVVVIVKIFFGAILAQYLGSLGAILGIGVSYLLGMIIFSLICKYYGVQPWEHDLKSVFAFARKSDIVLLTAQSKNIVSILTVGTLATIYPSIDILVARHGLDNFHAGLYSAASTLSSLIYFASVPILNILMTQLNRKDISKSLSYIKEKFIVIIALCSFSILLFLFMPKKLLDIFGPSYAIESNTLWLFALNMSIVTIMVGLLQVMVLFKPILSFIVSVFVLILVIIETNNHNTSSSTIIGSAITSYLVGLAVLIIVSFRDFIKFQKGKI